MLTMDEIKDRLIVRYSSEDIVELLQPDVEDLVEGLHEFIEMNTAAVLELIDHDEDEWL